MKKTILVLFALILFSASVFTEEPLPIPPAPNICIDVLQITVHQQEDDYPLYTQMRYEVCSSAGCSLDSGSCIGTPTACPTVGIVHSKTTTDASVKEKLNNLRKSLCESVSGCKFIDGAENEDKCVAEAGLLACHEAQYDYNDDGFVGENDYQLLGKRYLKKIECPVGKVCDINNNGQFDSDDQQAFGAKFPACINAAIADPSLEISYCELGAENKEDCVIPFIDQNLEKAVKLKLFPQQKVTLNVAAGLSNLDLKDIKIKSLDGLEFLKALKHLYLNNNEISDISALSGLTKLETLSLSKNQISDINALSSLTKLQQLYLSYNQISDISALSGLTKLQSLHMRQNSISVLSPLKDLENLNSLDLLQQTESKLSSNCQKFIGGENNEANKKAVAKFLKQCASACPNLPPDKIADSSCNVIGDFNGDNNVDSQDISTIKGNPLLFWGKISEGIESLQKFVSSMITNLGSK